MCNPLFSLESLEGQNIKQNVTRILITALVVLSLFDFTVSTEQNKYRYWTNTRRRPIPAIASLHAEKDLFGISFENLQRCNVI